MDKNKKRIGILRGGEGDYYETSLKNGSDLLLHVYENLNKNFKVLDILVDSKGIWHFNGLPIMPADLFHKVDLVWNVSHPNFSQILKNFSIPFIESKFSILNKNNREILNHYIKNNVKVNMPRNVNLSVYEENLDGPPEEYAFKKAQEVFQKFTSPWIIKSNLTQVVQTFPDLVNAILNSTNYQKSILVEESIPGKVFSTHSVSNFRNQDIYVFPPEGFHPNAAEKVELIELAKSLHKHLGQNHYLKSDFILKPKKFNQNNQGSQLYLTNLETIPNLYPDSQLSKSCQIVGAQTSHVLEAIIMSALVNKQNLL
jgi:D-alanine-D-alanine ligase-like ATP-grasp enzyme